MKAKLTFRNSVVYAPNKSLRLLAKKLGVSHTQVSKYIKQLKEQGLLVEHSGNLVFVSKKELGALRKGNKIAVFIDKKASVKQISDMLKFSVLKKNAEQQQFMLKLKSDLKSDKGFVDVKKVRKYIYSKPGEKTDPNVNFVISNENLAKKLNVSSQAISYLKKKWHKMGLVQFYRQFKKVGTTKAKESWFNKQCNVEGLFCSNRGVIYKSLPSKFIILGIERESL
jgi:biotin operon repressor